jgi:hypothetical protein
MSNRPRRRRVLSARRSTLQGWNRPPTRVALRPHDPQTGEEIEREEVAKGYEYERGQFVTFTPVELKALDVESSKIIDLKPSCRAPRSTRCISAPRIRLSGWPDRS